MKAGLSTILLLVLSTNLTIMAQSTKDEKSIAETITKFVNAADQQNDQKLEAVLDSNFRLSLNQMFGGKGLMFIDKQTYLNKIKAKEFGGDKRQVKLEQVVVVNNNASVKATFTGSKMTIVTLLQLVRTNPGEWKILSDLPTVL
jgi:Putative lumazine-binding